MNEFATDGTFGHSWSLAIEEKFYFVWPLLAFAIVPLRSRRAALAGVLVVGTAVTALLPGWWTYPAIYTPILAGCLVAIIMHSRAGFARLRPLLGTVGAALLVVALMVGVFLDNSTGHVHVWFGLVAAAVMATVVAGPVWFRSALAVKPLRFLGTRAYAVYLFHPITNSAIDRIVPAGQAGVGIQVVRFLLMLVVALAVADVLHRLVERPLVRIGHRVTGRKKATRAVPSAQ